jgi:hypothetical protein
MSLLDPAVGISGQRIAAAIRECDCTTTTACLKVSARTATAADITAPVTKLEQQIRAIPQCLEICISHRTYGCGQEDAGRYSAIRIDARDKPTCSAPDIFALFAVSNKHSDAAVVPDNLYPAPVLLTKSDPVPQYLVQRLRCQG